MALRQEAERGRALPEVAAPAPRPVPAKPAPVPEKQKRAPSTSTDVWAIQVGAFAQEASARRLVERLESKGYPVEVLPSDGANARWRVRVQPLRGEGRAKGLAARLKSEEGLPTWVMALEAGSR